MARKAKSKESSLASAARILGRKGGKIGGPARSKALTPQQRSEIAKKGGIARHAKD